MGRAIKLLLFVFCVTAFVAFFGDKFMLVAENIETQKPQEQKQTAQKSVYKQVYMNGSGGSIRIPMSRDGHYWVTLDVNGTPLRFMVDTGASNIVLTYEAAARAGLDPRSLAFNRAFRTANGVGYQAVVKLKSVSLKAIEVTNIYASVTEQGRLRTSLLGMNFLNKLSSFTFENRELVLKP